MVPFKDWSAGSTRRAYGACRVSFSSYNFFFGRAPMRYLFVLAVILFANRSNAAEITWEVHNNFSIFKSMNPTAKNGQQSFFEQLSKAVKCETEYHTSEKVFTTTCPGPLPKLPTLENVDADYSYDPRFIFNSSAGNDKGPRIRVRRINFSAIFPPRRQNQQRF